jgi:hypothetical protein
MLHWIQKEEYLKNVGYLPEEYVEGDALLQWTYNPRTKASREYLVKIGFDKKAGNPSKQSKKGGRKKKT